MIQIDMEMPEKCGLCPLFHAEHPMHCQGVKADRKKKIVAPYGQPRPDWCPLHEVIADPDTVSRQAVIECLEHLSACNEPLVEIGTDDETFIGKYEAITEISDLPPSPTPSRPHIASLETPCDDCDVADKCTYESNCPREAIWKAEHEWGAV